eukprot:1929547-Rhodomonas_salina.1
MGVKLSQLAKVSCWGTLRAADNNSTQCSGLRNHSKDVQARRATSRVSSQTCDGPDTAHRFWFWRNVCSRLQYLPVDHFSSLQTL